MGDSLVMKKIIILLFFNGIVDTIFMVFSKNLYFLAFILPIVNIVLILLFFKEISLLQKSATLVSVAMILSVVQLVIIKKIGDDGDYAITIVFTVILTILPLLISAIVLPLKSKSK